MELAVRRMRGWLVWFRFRVVLMIALYNQEKSPRSMKGVWSMEVGWGPGGLGSVFLLRLPSFLEVSGTRFAGNTYVLAAKAPCYLVKRSLVRKLP